MRSVLFQDVLRVASALLQVPPSERYPLCCSLFERAAEADAYRARTGRIHPRFGNGTLTSATEAFAHAENQTLENRVFVSCLILVLRVLEERQTFSTSCNAASSEPSIS